MTDTDLSLTETDETDYAKEEYAEATAPYQDVLDDKALRRLKAYRECTELVERGVAKKIEGDLDQINGLYKIWANNLWKAEGYRSQESWVQDYLVYHKVTIADSRTGPGREKFFGMVRGVAKGLSLGMGYEDALKLGLNYTSIEELERSGAVEFKPVVGKRGKAFVPVVTSIGEKKLLKDGLVAPKQYFDSLATMSSRDALQTVQHDVGRKYTYCSFFQEYLGGTILFDESQARTFAVEVRHVDPNNGETPYQMKVTIPNDVPDNVVKDMIRKWKSDYGRSNDGQGNP